MFAYISQILHQLGYSGVALLMALEAVIPPLPSELIMPLAGFLAGRGVLSLWGVILAGSAGSVAGSFVWYYAGRTVGEDGVQTWVARHGRWLGITRYDVSRARTWFDRHGGLTMLLGRLIPGVRILISIPAGLDAMPLVPYVLFVTLGTVLWNTVLAYIGSILGRHFRVVSAYLGPIAWVGLGIVVAGTAAWLYWRGRHREGAHEGVGP